MSSSTASITAGLTPERIAALDGQSHDLGVYTYATIFSALSILAVAMRLTSKHMKKLTFDIDDLLIVFALVHI